MVFSALIKTMHRLHKYPNIGLQKLCGITLKSRCGTSDIKYLTIESTME